jgi:protein TonB
MSAASNGRVLRIALAGSLAVHLVVAAILYSHPAKAQPPQKPDKSYIIHLPAPTPTPPPPPPKRALPQPQHKSPAVRPPVHPQRVIARNDPHAPPAPPVQPSGDPVPYPVDTSAPIAAPTDAPFVPTPTPKPACSAPDIAAKTLVTQSADRPENADVYTGTAKVQVDLDASGNVVGASIYQSTGSMELDRAAVAAARASRYAPEERDCKNVSGSYLFVVDFQ